jgi:hypothetical protein
MKRIWVWIPWGFGFGLSEQRRKSFKNGYAGINAYKNIIGK